jgi:hypothetical protein
MRHTFEGIQFMDSTSISLDLLMELESRHNELLVRLDELDKRVEKTLSEYQSLRVRRTDPLPALKVG